MGKILLVGGRTGLKIHKGTPGNAWTDCGHTIGKDMEPYNYLWKEVRRSSLCIKCFGPHYGNEAMVNTKELLEYLNPPSNVRNYDGLYLMRIDNEYYKVRK